MYLIYGIDNPMFIVDATAILTGQLKTQRFGFSYAYIGMFLYISQ